jgi:hypothetical protein
MPCVHLKTYGPESAGDDAALIQRKASFDTRRADRTLVMPEGRFPEPSTGTLDASVAQRQSATFTPWKSEGQHLPDARGANRPPGGWSRMERQVVVAHLAGSSILLIHPGSDDPQHNAAGRDGDLTGFIRPKISGQYGALRLGPGR